MKKIKRLFGMLLAVMLLITAVAVLIPETYAYAYEEKNGEVSGESVNVRENAGTDSTAITKLSKGHVVRVIGEKTASNGGLWYQITFEENGVQKSGYMHSAYVKVLSVCMDKDGYVTGDGVNVRSGAGTSNAVIIKLNTGHEVHIKGSTATDTGTVWYHITFTKDEQTYEGFMSSAYIRVAEDTAPVDPSEDPEYEKYLEQQGFPESYRTYLRRLHKKNPLWTFVAFPTGLNWEDAVAAESRLGTNLVPLGSITAFKSLQIGAINWTTGQWIGFDGAAWVAAAEGAVRYYMDPRSFLKDENTILQFESQKYELTQTREGVESIIKGTHMEYGNTVIDGVTIDFADIFMRAGEAYNISPYHLATRARQETGVNGSNSSKQIKDEAYQEFHGYYNFFNIGAYPDNGYDATYNGLLRAKKEGWDSPEKSIMGAAEILAQNYIARGQNTLYFQKFDVVGYNNSYYAHQYMTNLLAAESEAKTMEKTYANFREAAITYIVPVYLNMPETPEDYPSYNGSAYSVLSSLEVSGCSLNQRFDGYRFSYSVAQPLETESVQITAAAYAPGAVISGTGAITLEAGENDVEVTCTGTDGTANTYHILITRTGTVRKPGDANADGIVNSFDALWILEASARLEALTDSELKYMDLNHNGIVDAEDALMVLQYITGYIEEL